MGAIKMREEVIARHLGSGEKRIAFVDYEKSTLVDKDNNYLNPMFWTYEEKSGLDLSPGFILVALLIFIGICAGAGFIFSGAPK